MFAVFNKISSARVAFLVVLSLRRHIRKHGNGFANVHKLWLHTFMHTIRICSSPGLMLSDHNHRTFWSAFPTLPLFEFGLFGTI